MKFVTGRDVCISTSSVICDMYVTCICEVPIAVSSYLSHFLEAAPCVKLATEHNMGVVTLPILSGWSFGIWCCAVC